MSETGLALSEIDTPFLWVDLAILEQNIAYLSGFLQHAGVAWRPHFKGIKTSEIAKMAVASGAIGMTCAKLSEAEILAAAGVKDLLVANQIVGPRKCERFARLCGRAEVKVAVDAPANVEELGEAARAHGVSLGVVVEVDIGLHRAGVAPGTPAVELSQLVAATPGLRFMGLMGWEGQVAAIQDSHLRRTTAEESLALLDATAALCRRRGLSCEIVSGGGTADYATAARSGVLTEVQAGGALFCDSVGISNGVETQPSLFVRSMVTSASSPTRCIFDAGFKALPQWVGKPIAKGLTEVRSLQSSAEHLTITFEGDTPRMRPGECIDFIVAYGDTTIVLYDKIYGVRNGRVERTLSIDARNAVR